MRFFWRELIFQRSPSFVVFATADWVRFSIENVGVFKQISKCAFSWRELGVQRSPRFVLFATANWRRFSIENGGFSKQMCVFMARIEFST